MSHFVNILRSGKSSEPHALRHYQQDGGVRKFYRFVSWIYSKANCVCEFNCSDLAGTHLLAELLSSLWTIARILFWMTICSKMVFCTGFCTVPSAQMLFQGGEPKSNMSPTPSFRAETAHKA